MAVMRKRNRLVSFRLSDQEYEALQHFTVNEGARSISDFARSALCGALETTRVVGDGGSGKNQDSSDFNQTVERLVITMGELNRVISKLSVLVESKSANGEGQ